MIYDRNRISIEGDTDIAFTEDVAARYEAYGWHVQTVDWTNGGTDYDEDVPALYAAIRGRRRGHRPAVAHRPRHDHRLAGPQRPGHRGGPRQRARRRRGRGDQEGPRLRPRPDLRGARRTCSRTPATLRERGAAWGAEWDEQYDAWSAAHPDVGDAAAPAARPATLPDGLRRRAADRSRPTPRAWPPASASGKVINAIAPMMPELWGGSADLAGSNNTTIEGAPSFIPAGRSHRRVERRPLPGPGAALRHPRARHGRDHERHRVPTAAPASSAAPSSPSPTTCAARCGVAALSRLPVTYVWTHDSIGLGEDGPTHQPIEHLAALRAMPGLDVVRPADANETAACLADDPRAHRPAGRRSRLTRQNVPIFPRGDGRLRRHRRRRNAAATSCSTPRAARPTSSSIGTGSEVQLAVAGARRSSPRTASRPASSRCPACEWFEEQDQAYRDRVLPPIVKARVSVEAGVAQGWREIVGDQGRIVSIDHYGASADYAADLPASSASPPRPWPTRPRTASRDDSADHRTTTETMTDRLKALADAGVSIWLDDLSRERIETGNLADLVEDKHVVGVTTNPTIFAGAHRQRRALRRAGAQARRRRRRRRQGDLRAHHRGRPQRLRRARAGLRRAPAADGRVSIEVEPDLAHDTEAHHRLGPRAVGGRRPAQRADQDPGDHRGAAGDHRGASREGISVNVTLIFGLERYRDVMDAYVAGLEKAPRQRARPRRDPLGGLVLRLPRRHRDRQAARGKIGTDEPGAARARPRVANARLAYAAFEEVLRRRPLGGARPPPAPTASVRCGPPPA